MDEDIQSIELDIQNIRMDDVYCIENNGCSKIMTPDVARLRNYTYSLPIFVDVVSTVTVRENDNTVILPNKLIKNILFGKIRSDYWI